MSETSREEQDKGNHLQHPEEALHSHCDAMQAALPCWVHYCPTEWQGCHGFVAQAKILSPALCLLPTRALLATRKLWTCPETAKTVAMSTRPK